MTKAQDELRKRYRSRWHYEEPPGVIEWAERHVRLDSRLTARPGLYNTSHTPYVRGVLEALTDPGVNTVTLCWGSQTGKTLTLAVWLAYRIANDPAPALLVMPNADLARSYSETRLTPLFENCPPVKAVFPTDSDDYKNLEIQFKTMTLSLVGSNSPANISSRPVCIAVLDELDKFAPPTDKEASAHSLALERTKAFPGRKHVLTSTPTLNTGDIWQNYLAGTQETFHVPCPHCGEVQAMEFDSIKWDQTARAQDGKWDMRKVGETARYHCTKCEQPWDEGHRRKAIEQGAWVAGNLQGDPAHRSFRLPSWYSNIGFGETAKKFLTEKHYFQGLQNFVNGWLAMPWQDQFSDEDKPIPAGAFTMRSAWDQAAVGLMGVDVQQDSFYVVVRLFNEKGESRLWLAEKAVSWDQVELIFRSVPAQKKFGCVDSGYRTKEVYRVCSRNNWLAMKGEDGFMGYQHRAGNQTMLRVYAPETMIPEDNCYFMRFRSQLAQDLLAWLRAGQGPEWLVANDAGSEYLDHLKSHRKTNTFSRRTGKVTYEWVRMKSRADHFYDAETMVAVLASYGGLIAAPDPAAEKESDK